jgi:beta-glucosidase
MRAVKLAAASGAALLACSLAFGQSGDFLTKGRVLSGGTPLPMATITYTSLAKRLSWDFSKDNGNFGGGTGVKAPIPQDRVTLAADAQVSIDIFDMSGKLVGSVAGKLNKGTYTLEPVAAKLTQSVYALRIKAGNEVFCQKMVNTGLKNGGYAITLSSAKEPMVLAKKLAAIDTVRVGKTGYTPVKIPIDNYDMNIGDVSLTAVNIEGKVDSIFATLSQLDKGGQLCMPMNSAVTAATAASNNAGSIFGGGGALDGSSASASANFIDGINRAMMTSSTRKIPVLAAYDFVHGASACPGATFLPHNINMGAIQDTLLVQKAFRVQAIEVRACGCTWGFGPCIAVIRDDRWGRAYEGFCETPERTQVMARHAVLGIQTSDLSLPLAYAACIKHFAGDGNTVGGANPGQTEGPDATARAINLPGYTAGVAAGAATVMPSFSSWCDGKPMHQNKALLNDWLKSAAAGGPNFKGFVVGDWNAGWPLPTCMDAGLDVPMCPYNNLDMISKNDAANKNNFNTLYSSSAAAAARIDDAVKRVLRVKCWMNLFSPENYLTNPNVTALIGNVAHHDVARACVRASSVLLKNANNVLPIPKTANVGMIGNAADNIGIQCGGWTISWQGQVGNKAGVNGTSVYTGVKALCTGTVTLGSATGDYILAFLSEDPYAETAFPGINLTGDKASSSNATVITQIATAKAAGKKVIGVLMSGRALDVSPVIDNCDAFIWAGWPGAEGNGLAQVLFADQGYKFTGKLPMTWPASANQEPINVGDGKTPRWAMGYGLTD